ncbi:MAG: hypothetical protein E3J96_00285 [Sulfurovum sp.]|nr:MAG: hypothetical protein E3J96_00285 [Sulfurovum sp.]
MAKQDKDLFSKLGIDIDNNKINIDINQTKAFFNSLQQKLEGIAQNIQKDISEGKVDMAENIGIKIDKENINIDLEKTKSFIEEFGKKIENFIGEIDKAVDDIGKK